MWMTSPGWLIAIVVAGVIAGGAWRARSLSAGGALAALVVGSLALHVGWPSGSYLIGWFLIASVLSRWGRAKKRARLRGIVQKDAQRDARQVLANGGAFAVACLPFLAHEPATAVFAAGALAAAGADTWATEIGTLATTQPWSLREGRRVPAGTSGAVTLQGTLAAAVGAVLLAGFAHLVGLVGRGAIPAVALGALSGALADTLIGAWIQERRWCPSCDAATEQPVHACGTATERCGGLAALDNDVVNALCTLVGAGVSVTTWMAMASP
jgi:uncharacterized protein (TIGR00297 family)